MYKLSLKNIYAAYDENSIINDINLDVKENELISLLGPSGCGKTTLLKVINGILKQTSGDILLDDRKINDLKINDRNIVMIFQDYMLFPHLSVEKNIGYGLKVRGTDKKIIKEKVDLILKDVGLDNYNNKSINELSGGEKQRVALARALIVEPNILLMDEPFSNLDANLRIKMRELTKELILKSKMTTILVTHDKEEAFSMSDKVAIMDKGRIISYDTPSNLYKNPKTKEIAKFLGYENIITSENKTFVIPNDSIRINGNEMDTEIDKNTKVIGEKIQYKGTVSNIIFEGKIKRLIINDLKKVTSKNNKDIKIESLEYNTLDEIEQEIGENVLLSIDCDKLIEVM